MRKNKQRKNMKFCRNRMVASHKIASKNCLSVYICPSSNEVL